MAAVAKGFVLRFSAAAEGDGRLVGGDLELSSRGINDRDRALDKEWAIIANCDCGGHEDSWSWKQY
jgi:hypothetical protein